jgi:hypothetical protein
MQINLAKIQAFGKFSMLLDDLSEVLPVCRLVANPPSGKYSGIFFLQYQTAYHEKSNVYSDGELSPFFVF